MKTTVDKYQWTITLDFQLDRLRAPDAKDPKTGRSYPRYYLPCDCCHEVHPVESNVVSYICETCDKPCHWNDCGLKYYEHFDENGNKTPCEPKYS